MMQRKTLYILLAILIGFFFIKTIFFNQSPDNSDASGKLEVSQNNKQYVCPMHAHIVSHKADSCPVCGMDLVINKSALESSNHDTGSDEEYPSVKISPTVKHNLGIRAAIVKRGDLTHNIETIGKITRVDPMARSRITSPVNGTLYKITDKYANDVIKQDEFLFSVESEELYAAEKTFQQAFLAGDKITASGMIPKLVVMGLDTEQIALLQNGTEPRLPARVYAKENGHIFTRRGEKGDAVTTSFTVFNLGGNYQVIEVTVEIFERQWDLVKEGQSATMELRNLPGKIFTGKVERVDEPVGYTTRALETRIKFKTDYEGLTQSTFARVIIKGKTKHDVITVPRDAVIRTARDNRVVLIKADDQFQPVKVKIGEESNGKIEILSGLKIGSKVVVSGQFLIDSESNLLADLRRMSDTNESTKQIQIQIQAQP